MQEETNYCMNDCGLFDFMAKSIGIQVLHPGGYEATDRLCSMIHLNKDSYVLDLACGTGTTAFYLSKKYNCKTTGIDISHDLIDQANMTLNRTRQNQKVNFEVADALKIPYPNDTFDVVIAQAFFILIDNKEKALEEIHRVLKPGGYFGSLELSWFKTPTENVYNELLSKTCSQFIPRMLKFEEWEAFYQSKFDHVETIKNPMTSGMLQMLKTEGLANFIKIMFKMMANAEHRKRMMEVQNTFGKYNDYIGYGVFGFRKPC